MSPREPATQGVPPRSGDAADPGRTQAGRVGPWSRLKGGERDGGRPLRGPHGRGGHQASLPADRPSSPRRSPGRRARCATTARTGRRVDGGGSRRSSRSDQRRPDSAFVDPATTARDDLELTVRRPPAGIRARRGGAVSVNAVTGHGPGPGPPRRCRPEFGALVEVASRPAVDGGADQGRLLVAGQDEDGRGSGPHRPGIVDPLEDAQALGVAVKLDVADEDVDAGPRDPAHRRCRRPGADDAQVPGLGEGGGGQGRPDRWMVVDDADPDGFVSSTRKRSARRSRVDREARSDRGRRSSAGDTQAEWRSADRDREDQTSGIGLA